jgi:phosphoribosylaminoimidazolecarboxamide formyltransferase/IMP cyclohydrolase
VIKVKRALISVSDKAGLVAFAKGLHNLGVEILSTGGTAKQLREANIPVMDVSDFTGYPEMLDGRVKTLHPKIHGGLLAVRDNAEHMQQTKNHEIQMIDMVIVNLYPFEKTIKKKSVSLSEAIENIDIGGPSMLRSAAKNFKGVGVICNPARYKDILKELDVNNGMLSDAVLFSLSVEAFSHTARYDSIISEFLAKRLRSEDFAKMPNQVSFEFSKKQDLRYGENPHQAAAFYRDIDQESGLAKIKQLHGKELSFNNILDLNAALDFIQDWDIPAATIIKHGNPTGVSIDETLDKAYKQAHSCDPLSAFGGIIGLNRKVDEKTAQAIIKSGFMECVIAPGFSKEAKSLLTKKKNLRLIELNLKHLGSSGWDLKRVYGGLLVQEKDRRELSENEIRVVTRKKPTKAQLESMLFGWRVIKNVKSNAIVLTKGKKTVGIGCGQTSRVESVNIAIDKAQKNSQGSILISDAFFPKTDNIDLAARAGIKAIIQPGGSIADKQVIEACDKSGIAMIFTGVRHFKH